ncbi:MAG: hypothetical protein AAF802_24180 [Planctomycetota bacterium]
MRSSLFVTALLFGLFSVVGCGPGTEPRPVTTDESEIQAYEEMLGDAEGEDSGSER